MPDIHAKRYSPSASCKWLNCPGSVVLEAEFPDRETDYTREGTLAHSIAELKLLKHFDIVNNSWHIFLKHSHTYAVISKEL